VPNRIAVVPFSALFTSLVAHKGKSLVASILAHGLNNLFGP
jgi:membrane protease YdiL (CAAX protease family)